MKRFINSLFVLAAPLSLCYTCSIAVSEGNKVIVSEEIAITDYRKIQLSVPGEMTYHQDINGKPYLKIDTDENILPLLEIVASGDRLQIKTKNNAIIRPSRLTITTNSAHLDNIDVSGSGQVHLAGEVQTERMEINLAGSGGIATDGLYCETMRIDVTGSGNAQLNGTCREASWSIAGSGNIRAFGCVVERLTCNLAGAGNMDITAREALTLNLAGSGNARYKGSPHVTRNISGSGVIERMD
ncbi:MAG: DUF2807 domain-containing protein [Odoribacteraceae bacterium]|jgi:hypothetical protein|nr:DUF2807 domain-containing protein [Odoribacteraceae bacterium]